MYASTGAIDHHRSTSIDAPGRGKIKKIQHNRTQQHHQLVITCATVDVWYMPPLRRLIIVGQPLHNRREGCRSTTDLIILIILNIKLSHHFYHSSPVICTLANHHITRKIERGGGQQLIWSYYSSWKSTDHQTSTSFPDHHCIGQPLHNRGERVNHCQNGSGGRNHLSEMGESVELRRKFQLRTPWELIC